MVIRISKFYNEVSTGYLRWVLASVAVKNICKLVHFYIPHVRKSRIEKAETLPF